MRWKVVPLIKPGCVPAVLGSGKCPIWYRWPLGQVRRLDPRAVALSQAWSAWRPVGVATVARELRDLAPLTQRLAVIKDPSTRSGRARLPARSRRHARLLGAFRVTPAEAAAYSSVRREPRAAHAGYVHTLQWFCASGVCPTVIGTIITYRDTSHITDTYARLLAGPLAAKLDAATRR